MEEFQARERQKLIHVLNSSLQLLYGNGTVAGKGESRQRRKEAPEIVQARDGGSLDEGGSGGRLLFLDKLEIFKILGWDSFSIFIILMLQVGKLRLREGQ